MGSKFKKTVYRMLPHEPVTLNEMAKEYMMSHKTALRALMHLALTEDNVCYKDSWRIYLFGKEYPNDG